MPSEEKSSFGGGDFHYEPEQYTNRVFSLYTGANQLYNVRTEDFSIRLGVPDSVDDARIVYDMIAELVFPMDRTFSHRELSELKSADSEEAGGRQDSASSTESSESDAAGNTDYSEERINKANDRFKMRAAQRRLARLTFEQFFRDFQLKYFQIVLIFHNRNSLEGGGTSLIPVGFMMLTESQAGQLGGPGLMIDQFALHPLFHHRHLGTRLHVWLCDWALNTPPVGETLVGNSFSLHYTAVLRTMLRRLPDNPVPTSTGAPPKSQSGRELLYYNQLGFTDLTEKSKVTIYELTLADRVANMLKATGGESIYPLKDILVKEKTISRTCSEFSLKLITVDDPTTRELLASGDKSRKNRPSAMLKNILNTKSSGTGKSPKPGVESPAEDSKLSKVKCKFVCQQKYFGLMGPTVWISDISGDLELLSAPLLRGVIRQNREKIINEGGSQVYAVVFEVADGSNTLHRKFVDEVLTRQLKLRNATKKRGLRLHQLSSQTSQELVKRFGPRFGLVKAK